jgi:hypothetical protein
MSRTFVFGAVVAGLWLLTLGFSTLAGKRQAETTYPRSLPIRHAIAENGMFAPGYFDLVSKSFYQFRHVRIRAVQVPQQGPFIRVPLLRPKTQGVSVVVVDLPVMFIRRDGESFGVGYLCAGAAAVYRWRGVSISADRAAKEFPSFVANALDLEKLKLFVYDIDISKEVKAPFEAKPRPGGATTKDE